MTPMKFETRSPGYKIELGVIDYEAAWELQRALEKARAANQIPDTLLLLVHPPVYTLGRSGKPEHLLMSREERDELGIAILDVDRGGDITFHGPGQLVAYPIRFLGIPNASGRVLQADFVGYIRQLEEVLIATVAAFGITAQRAQGLTGVWVNTGGELAKLAAIGVHVSARGVSTHGAALNITTDLRYFDGIVPCGIHDKQVCSMKSLLGSGVPTLKEVQTQFTASFSKVFHVDLSSASVEDVLAYQQK